MFLVVHEWVGGRNYVFTIEDPREAGFTGEVREDVMLDYDVVGVAAWPDGSKSPDVVLGRNPSDPNHYKVFKYASDRDTEIIEAVPGTLHFYTNWKQYRLDLHPSK